MLHNNHPSVIDLPSILTVPTWFIYSCNEHSINTAHLMLHTNHSLTHTATKNVNVPIWFSHPCNEHSINHDHLLTHILNLTFKVNTYDLFFAGLFL